MKWDKIFDNFKNNKILIIGDIMLDTYLIGKVERISPEAPVPVVDIDERIDKLGGAANVALNIKELGATPIICSIIGTDQRGFELKNLLIKNELTTKFIYKSENRKTTNKIRIIGNNTQMLRIDEETKIEITDKMFEKLKENIVMAVAENKINAIIFQDYDKGVIIKKLIDYIILLSEKRNIPVFVDPKLKNFNLYKNVKIFKPNFNELKRGLKNEELNIEKFEKIEPFVDKLMNEQNINVFYTTMGNKGIYLSYRYKDKIVHKHIEGEKRSVADVSGAGDTVMSLATLLCINGVDIVETAKISNIAGGMVCEKVGVVPINKEELLKEINNVSF